MTTATAPTDDLLDQLRTAAAEADDLSLGPRPHECDLVMKGGITSGIVYPPAIVQLARDHRFRSIGGGSAGAIGAAAAAAAEYGRGVPGGGFTLLANLPAQLAEMPDGQTVLQGLFQPQAGTAPLFEAFWYGRKAKGVSRIRGLLTRAARAGKVPVLGLLVLAVVVVAAVVFAVVGFAHHTAWSVVAGILLLLVAALATVAGWLWKVVLGGRAVARSAPEQMERNLHGLCTGMEPEGSNRPALTTWLYQSLQRMAGKALDSPLTYGDLCEKGITLVTDTTDLSHGTSESFPFDTNVWAFDPRDMAQLFPKEVCDHLLTAGQQALAGFPADSDFGAALKQDGLLPLPAWSELPIIMGARVSLSYPVLLSGVPFYSWSPQLAADGTWTMSCQKCWFSDGGILSNLPVHLFDDPLPSRPTYAINLSSGADPSKSAQENVWRPIMMNSGRAPMVKPITSTLGFLGAIFDTMQNWQDNLLTRAPGHADRICTIRLGQGEGGMNLDMAPDTITGMIPRGVAAGANLGWIARGTPAPDGGHAPRNIAPEIARNQWARNRFARYRLFIAGVSDYLQAAQRPYVGDGFAALAGSAAADTSLPYRSGWSQARATSADQALTKMFTCCNPAMADGAPSGGALAYSPGASIPPNASCGKP